MWIINDHVDMEKNDEESSPVRPDAHVMPQQYPNVVCTQEGPITDPSAQTGCKPLLKGL